MMPGEMRCPSCGTMTPIAPSCAHCGNALPDGSGRPRGLDREELEERIRLRRSGENPFHRGSSDWHTADAASGGAEFVPEPSDALARREPSSADEAPARVDHLADAAPAASGWSSGPAAEPASEHPASAPPVEPAPVQPLSVEPPTPPAAWPARDVAAREGPSAAPAGPTADRLTRDETVVAAAAMGAPDAPAGRFTDEPYRDEPSGDEPYRNQPYGDDGYGGYGGAYGPDDGDAGGPRRGGGLAVLGFVILGVAALLGGAIFFSLLSGSPGTADATPTPTVVVTPSPTGAGTPGESASGSPSASAGQSAGATPSPTGAPSAVPANFTAQAQPCATSDMDFHGCAQDGSTITGSKVWIWVGFRNARSSDVVGVTVLDHADGSSVGDGSIELTNIGCTPDKACTGYIQMPFSQLTAGAYDIQVTLNGMQVATSSFSVTS